MPPVGHRRRLLTPRRLVRPHRIASILPGLVLLAGVAYAFINLSRNLQSRNIASGFAYLRQPAGFEISDAWMAFSPQMSSGRALVVGLVDTLVAGAAIAVLVTVIGLLAGVMLCFGGAAGRALLRRYVAVTRNVPVLLHLVAWYTLFRQALPSPRGAFVLGPMVLSNRGLILPAPNGYGSWREIVAGMATAAVLAGILRVSSRTWSWRWLALAASAGVAAWACVLPISVPVLRGFNYAGGWSLSLEFCALVLAIGIYTGGYVSEIVRGAVDAFPGGQAEGAYALGLSRSRFFLLVMLPQVTRTIAPAMVNQYVNVIKLTSLGIVVGYPDLVSVSNASLNQTGQAVEAVALILATYLAISLLISLASQWLFGRRAAQAAAR